MKLRISIWRRHRGLILTCVIAVAVGLAVFVVAVVAPSFLQGPNDLNGFVTYSSCGKGPGPDPQLALSVDYAGGHEYKTYSQKTCDSPEPVLVPKSGLHLLVKRVGNQLNVWWSAPIEVKWSTIEVKYGDDTTDTVTLTSGQTKFTFQLAINDTVSTITVRGLGQGLPPAIQTTALVTPGPAASRPGATRPLSPIFTA